MKKQYLLIVALLVGTIAFAQTDKELTERTVDQNTIEGHIYFLASDELRGRDTGSPEIDIAARYLATTFQRYGVKQVPGATGYFQDVPLYKTVPAQVSVLQLHKTSVLANDRIVIEGSSISVTAPMKFIGYGTEEEFNKESLQGHVVVVKAGYADKQDTRSMMMGRMAKTSLAKAAGAKGVVELFGSETANWEQLYATFNRERIGFKPEETAGGGSFYIWAKDANGALEKAITSAKKSEATVSIGTATSLPLPSKNVVGMVEGTDPQLKNEFVMYSAHYDHIGVGLPDADGDSIYNGARDNAVGVVTVMSAAQNIAKYPTKRSAYFVLFTAEEKGLLGSRWLADNPLIANEQIVFCFNSDNGGYNDTSIATIVGLERTNMAAHIKQASETFGLKAIDDPAGEQGLFDRSDNVNFARKGIPAPTFSLGFTAFDEEIRKYYHQQADNPHNLDYEYLVNFFKAYVMSCRLIANDPETPFWIEGDKYYDYGQALYGR